MTPSESSRLAKAYQIGHYLWREWLSGIVFALLLTQFGASAVHVQGASMMPGLRNGELLAIPKIEGWAHHFGIGTYHRGDIVVFKPPASGDDWRSDYRGMPLPWRYRPYLVKRVVAVAGDQVQVRNGTVFVNGKALSEPRILNYWEQFCRDTTSPLATTPSAVTVPAGHYFVMGDNRSPGGSLDSRVFGPVAVQDIAGRAVASLWPLFAKANATPPCDMQPNPEQRVVVSGAPQWNPRWLVSNGLDAE